MLTKLTGLLASLCVLGTNSQYATKNDRVYVDPATEVIRDKEGRQLLFHGVNAIYKIHPYIPDMYNISSDQVQDAISAEDIENLKSWGMNLVRLGVMWEAVETSEGVYNQTYLDEVEKLINNLGE